MKLCFGSYTVHCDKSNVNAYRWCSKIDRQRQTNMDAAKLLMIKSFLLYTGIQEICKHENYNGRTYVFGLPTLSMLNRFHRYRPAPQWRKITSDLAAVMCSFDVGRCQRGSTCCQLSYAELRDSGNKDIAVGFRLYPFQNHRYANFRFGTANLQVDLGGIVIESIDLDGLRRRCSC